MPTPTQLPKQLLTLAAGLLVVKVTLEVVAGYRNYFPPNFDSDFLSGRDGYFHGAYQWAFYPHLVSGPLSLFLGLTLLSRRFLTRFPRGHRWLGRVQVVNVLLFVVPSGLWMARHTSTGPVAGVGFAILAALTSLCVAMGWRRAVQHRFVEHRRWMTRGFLLLCSAVTLRVLGGLGTVLAVRSLWFDPVISWASWLAPLTIFEMLERRKARGRSLPMERGLQPTRDGNGPSLK